VRFGLALPQYEFSVPDGRAGWSTVRDWALRAEELGFDSVWISDHLFLDLSRYGGDDRRQSAMECFTTIGALAAITSKVRLGVLVVCNDLRAPSLVAKMTATLDVLSGGRIELGLGAGWYEPEYRAAGIPFERPGVRIDRLAEAVQIVSGMLTNETFSFEGKHYRVHEALNLPRPIQKPRPPVWIGGKGDRVVATAAKFADGYNTVWAWTPEDYGERMRLLDAAAAKAGRDPSSIRRSVGLYCMPGAEERDLQDRWTRYREATPAKVPESFPGRVPDKLYGEPDLLLERISKFEALGAEEVILGFGILPFQIADETAVELFAREVIPSGR
jgi:probable F420-dependent oxidoreductase